MNTILRPQLETHRCPADRSFYVVLDPAQCIPDNPGDGTPAMVYGPKRACATFWCAVCEGELDDAWPLPDAVRAWLDSIEEYVTDWVDSAMDCARCGL